MNESNEYIPNQQHTEKKKIFTLQPAQDDITYKVIQARLDVTRDRELSKGARLLFVFLLDLAMSPYTHIVRGVVVISVTKLTENLSCCRRSVFDWVKELMTKRVIWVSKQFMPNFWALNTYHISALDPVDQPSQLPTRDGLWGNGARRPVSPPGLGARARWCKNVHAETPAELPVSQENAPDGGNQMHPSIAIAATDSHTDCDGQSQELRRAVAASAAGNSKNVNATPAAIRTGGAQKGAHFKPSRSEIETQKDSLSCLTAEKGRRGPARELKQFSGSPASRKLLEGEKDFMEGMGLIAGPKEMINWGGRWRNRFRENPDKAQRVLAELTSMHKEKRIQRNAGACADDLWRRFV